LATGKECLKDSAGGVWQNYWISGLFSTSRIRSTRKHNVSKLSPVSETLFSSCLEFPKMDKIQKPSNLRKKVY
jgi:hypothetical protein